MNFFDKKCSIWDYSITVVDWEQIKQNLLIYENIACDFYKPKNRYKNTEYAKEGWKDWFEVVLTGNRTQAKKGQTIELIDPTTWSYWKFIIDILEVYRNINGNIDNILLYCIQREWI